MLSKPLRPSRFIVSLFRGSSLFSALKFIDNFFKRPFNLEQACCSQIWGPMLRYYLNFYATERVDEIDVAKQRNIFKWIIILV